MVFNKACSRSISFGWKFLHTEGKEEEEEEKKVFLIRVQWTSDEKPGHVSGTHRFRASMRKVLREKDLRKRLLHLYRF